MERILNPQFAKYQESFANELRGKGRSDATVIAYAKDIEQLLNLIDDEIIKLKIKLEEYEENEL